MLYEVITGAVSGIRDASPLIRGKAPFLALVALSAALGTYSFFEARELSVERNNFV